MFKIAFIGLGAMGSRMAANLLRADCDLTVWNRSPEPAAALKNLGAKVAATPADAARNADIVFSMVRDDEASWRVWCDPQSGAFSTMREGAVAVESSTLSLAAVRRLSEAAEERQIAFLEAPVAGTLPAAASASLIFFLAGNAAACEQVNPVLLQMGSAVNYVGESGNAAITKLVTNSLLGIQVVAWAEILTLLQENNADIDAVLQAVSTTPSWAPISGFLTANMLAGDFSPQFPVDLIEKDFGYMEQASGQTLSVIRAVRATFQKAKESGLAQKNMTAVIDLLK